MNIGQELKARRLELGMTQQQLADLTGVSRAYIAQIEANRKKLSFDTALPFIEALGGTLTIDFPSK